MHVAIRVFDARAVAFHRVVEAEVIALREKGRILDVLGAAPSSPAAVAAV